MTSPQVWAAVISALTSVVLTAFVGAIAWYLRGEYREHKKNTAVRKYLVGDPEIEQVDDVGYVDDVDERFDELRDEHRHVREELSEVKALVQRIAAQIETHDDFDFTRGGKSSQRSSRGDD